MNRTERLALMIECDLSQNSPRNPGLYGFKGSYIHLKRVAMSMLKENLSKAEMDRNRGQMYSAYGYIVSKYTLIPENLEERLDTEEEKQVFSPIVKTRTLLPRLGRAVHTFIMGDYPSFKGPNQASYDALDEVLNEIIEVDNPPFVLEIDKLYRDIHKRRYI